MNFQAALPVVLHTLHLFSVYSSVIDTYLFRILIFFGVSDPMRLFRSVIIQQLIGIEYQYHYRQFYPEIRSYFASCCSLYGADIIIETVSKITTSMASWKVILIHAGLVRARCPKLLYSDGKIVADIDVTTLRSSSSAKEGAEAGYNKKNRGKPCFQLSATFIGKIFVDAKLFPGCSNPKDFFQKAVKRAISLGFAIDTVRADTAYMTLENLLFLIKLSLGYAIGISASFNVVKEGIEKFGQLSRQKSSRIVHAGKGIALLDIGQVSLKGGIQTRLLIVRRISRKKKKGIWHIKTYYYGISSNLELSPLKLYRFYHKRQCIEAGFRELKNHYNLERLPFRNLKANEFWIVCKIMAMTLLKIFQQELLPKSLHSLLRKTLFRRIFRKGLYSDKSGKVQAVPKSRYTWHLRRMLCKTGRMETDYNF
jgi:hypothetical protein